jgi:hypothetical protein
MKRPERQLQETVAMLLIGDGVLGLLRPAAHCAVWRTGHVGWNSVVDWFAARPLLVRACGAAEAAAGVWLAERQFARLSAADAHANRLAPRERVSASHGA